MLDNAERRVQDELLPDEKILLVTYPNPSKHLSRADLVLVPFSLAWGGFAIFWEVSAIVSNGPLMFRIFGIPFVLMGLYFMFGRFVYKAWKKRRTVYALTDKRVIVVTSGSAVCTEYLDRMAAINRTVGKDGFGTVNFGSGDAAGHYYGNSGTELLGSRMGIAVPLAFYDIPDAEEVYRRVNEARAAQSH